MKKITALKGFADLFTPQSTCFTHMEDTARRIFGAYGYNELRIPIVESTELFQRSIGATTDIVQKEMFTFPDRKGRSLTLRPEATAGIMRAYIESNYQARESVAKFFSYGPMFRYERPQKGRMRQFHQLDCECLGAEDPYTDAEVIMMLMHFLHELGLDNLSAEINTLGCRACRPLYRAQLLDFLKSLDTAELCGDCQNRMESNPLRVLDCKNPECNSMTVNAPDIASNVCSECEAHFAIVKGVLEKARIPFKINPRLVRGLDYYTRTTFEVVSNTIGAQGSVAGGGRFDGLIAQLGGGEIPGIGFACGMERLALLLEQQNTLPKPALPDFFIVPLDEEARMISLEIAQKLRTSGLRGEMSTKVSSMKSQMRQAAKSQARYALLIGQEERDNNSLVVKNMETGEQKTLLQTDLSSWVAEINS